jgi:hypothetical protein
MRQRKKCFGAHPHVMLLPLLALAPRLSISMATTAIFSPVDRRSSFPMHHTRKDFS